MNPEIHYARTPEGVHIAYTEIGGGPMDVVFPGWGHSNIELAWGIPNQRRFLQKIGSLGRLIYFDPRGMGSSDRIGGGQLLTLDSQMADVLSVMDAVGSDRAVMLGSDAAGPMAILFAATHPERTAALIIYGSEPSSDSVPGYPGGWTEEEWDAYLEKQKRRWGQREYVREYIKEMAPSMTLDDRALDAYTTAFRMTGGPGTALALETMWRETDVRDVLPAVHVPTLILHRTDDQLYSIAGARFTAERISGSRFVELPGVDHLAWEGDVDLLISEIDRFLRSVREEEAEFDRVLATVMFTDIVGSTERSSALGDRSWQSVLADHDRIVRGLLARYRGREIKTLGDGFLATFDGPARAVRCALAIAQAVRDFGIDVRIGLHTGEIEFDGDDVRGLAVNIGSRVGAIAGPSEVLVSGTVKDLVAGSGLVFEDTGEHELKGVPDRCRLYRVMTD
ncbi:MAG: adenylate/guanylate cyclase domain-containing protein [Actinomycetota bacterium]